MGDAVNLASRLEGITKEYGADIIVGEDTRNAVPDVVFRELDRVRVKGKDEAVPFTSRWGCRARSTKAQTRRDQALRTRRCGSIAAQDWDQAELQLFNLQKHGAGQQALQHMFRGAHRVFARQSAGQRTGTAHSP